ncbi:hypothetical protein J2Z21_002133 [Streptomyces griseochromogenes]|uniref:DUF397 domain-containing protein n=1 Tax=Streptomyces griseochromogenes TaxID=68214 RepID=A0A1B1ARS0_9ACTN|nr:DUF397 domain-containing protein [Streptomyces griseochromogenes]ANP49246.1 DUF397 domain-containing protein [Streptomyces griseochromogenes]MBP2049202.1 hypothetical protein [Streptomyces griseochromogenes]
MLTPHSWRKSSFSGGDEGDACVEVADLDSHIAIRDSKTPTRATLAFPPEAFAPFIQALKSPEAESR